MRDRLLLVIIIIIIPSELYLRRCCAQLALGVVVEVIVRQAAGMEGNGDKGCSQL